MSADWYVAGQGEIVNGSGWEPGTAENKMKDIGDGYYQLVVKGKSLTEGTTYQYKVTDGTWSNAYGWSGGSDGNASFTPHITGTYDITYIFNSTTNDVWEASALLTDGPDIYLHSNKNWSDDDT